MRTVAAYSLTQVHSSWEQILEGFNGCRSKAEDWLRWKGVEDVGMGQREVQYTDGRLAQFTGEYVENNSGTLASFVLYEPIDGGQFETQLDIAASSEGLVFFCQLRTESNEPALVPMPFEVRCPNVVREFVRTEGWTSGSSLASGNHISCIGREQGEQVIADIWDPGRGLPVVVVSQLEGNTLSANISQDLAYDLAGLAVVVEIDDETSWLLSETKGRDWSCYGGAVRLYWPFQGIPDDPYRHPLWTKTRLHWGGVDSFIAAKRVHRRLHRWVFGQSTFQPQPRVIGRVREQYLTEQRSRASEADDYSDLAHSYATENQRLKKTVEDDEEQIRVLQDHIEELRAQNRELNISRLWTNATAEGEGASAESDDNLEVDDIVDYAKDSCKNLTFGADIERGVSGLAPQARPPSKILRYLQGLETMTQKLNEGTLGMQIRHWLTEQRISVSGESETTGGSAVQMSKRTWDDGCGNKRIFHYHLKPNEGTSPDRCVRIYFEYEKASQKTIVGWIGRHPE